MLASPLLALGPVGPTKKTPKMGFRGLSATWAEKVENGVENELKLTTIGNSKTVINR